MDLKEIEALYLHRQSCREYTDKPVPEELLTEVCRLALLAPSAFNAQPWKLVAVTGEKTKEVAKCLQGMGMNRFTSGAPAFVAVVEGKSNLAAKAGGRVKGNDFLRNDLGILTAHLVLAADAAGLGSCIIGWRDEKKVREVLGIDKNLYVPLVVSLGYPPEGYETREKKRKPLDNVFQLIK